MADLIFYFNFMYYHCIIIDFYMPLKLWQYNSMYVSIFLVFILANLIYYSYFIQIIL